MTETVTIFHAGWGMVFCTARFYVAVRSSRSDALRKTAEPIGLDYEWLQLTPILMMF